MWNVTSNVGGSVSARAPPGHGSARGQWERWGRERERTGIACSPVRLFVCSFVERPVWWIGWLARSNHVRVVPYTGRRRRRRGIINRWPMSGFHLLSRSLLRRLDAGSLLRAWIIATVPLLSSGNWACKTFFAKKCPFQRLFTDRSSYLCFVRLYITKSNRLIFR